jgi:hypothetical protein
LLVDEVLFCPINALWSFLDARQVALGFPHLVPHLVPIHAPLGVANAERATIGLPDEYMRGQYWWDE